MNYIYKVSLAGIKGFYRIYKVNGKNSLYTFHKQLRADLEFPVDQQILFKALDAGDAVVARYALMDIGWGAVDAITVDATVKAGITSFVYFYDVKSKKSVIITLEGETSDPVQLPTITDSKGPVPLEFENGYVAFEDLPPEHRHLPGESSDNDDEEDEEDEDDEDDDKPEEIYDENEDA